MVDNKYYRFFDLNIRHLFQWDQLLRQTNPAHSFHQNKKCLNLHYKYWKEKYNFQNPGQLL